MKQIQIRDAASLGAVLRETRKAMKITQEQLLSRQVYRNPRSAASRRGKKLRMSVSFFSFAGISGLRLAWACLFRGVRNDDARYLS